MSRLSLCIPFTSANLGPGFDLFGLALNKVARFDLSLLPPEQYRFSDAEGPLRMPLEHNYVYRSYRFLLDRAALPDYPGLDCRFELDLPSGRGFGSSAVAYLAGIRAACLALRSQGKGDLTLTEELNLLVELEGHADNIIASRLGGWVFIPAGLPLLPQNIIQKPVPPELRCLLLFPEYSVSTRESRAILPAHYAMPPILKTMSGALYWLEYLNSGNAEYLRQALHLDCLHESYRAVNIPHFESFRNACQALGCLGLTISGSGPGLIAFCLAEDLARIEPQLQEKARQAGLSLVSAAPSLQGLLEDAKQ
ncbi:MAG: hypothetical protein HS115_07405 [Spirochaetales bacterium]|nr:hypothetical protein [Spirochaetales bacterium]